MKSLAYFLVLTLVSSIAMSKFNDKPCDSPCLVCQQTVYNLKFYGKANCKNQHCRTTCHKVHSSWNTAASPFEEFKKDQVGKCDICFRAGYCSVNECSVQKDFETAVISKIVDEASFNGVVDTKEMDKMIHSIVHDNQVDFKKVKKEVNFQMKQAVKKMNEQTVNKLTKAVSKVVNIQSPEESNKHQVLN